MRKVLISTQPQWCEKICHEIGKDENGKPIYEKRIEVRKSAPKEVPFKVYIYEAKGKKIECGFHFEDTGITLREKYVYGMHKARIVKHYRNEGRGKVIGEFICDKVDEYKFHEGLTEFNSMGLPSRIYGSYLIFADDYKSMCLSYDQVKLYGKGKTLYGWHISDLKIYDKPKELSEFYRICKASCKPNKRKTLCLTTKSLKFNGCDRRIPITHPPQSWFYVEEKMYKYGMRSRGFSLGCQPMQGFVERIDDRSGRYYDLLLYNRELSQEEIKNYELDFLGIEEITNGG